MHLLWKGIKKNTKNISYFSKFTKENIIEFLLHKNVYFSSYDVKGRKLFENFYIFPVNEVLLMSDSFSFEEKRTVN